MSNPLDRSSSEGEQRFWFTVLSNLHLPSASVGEVTRLAAVARLFSIGLQLGLLLLVMQTFQIEPASGLLKAGWLILPGFLIHAALPIRYRLPFFLALSVAVFVAVLGASAFLVFGIGLAIIAICHLPLRLRTRIMFLGAIALPLVAMRANLVHLGPKDWQTKALPVLGSIFIFRLVIYLYDLSHEKEPATIWTRLAYFFLLPNAFFVLFPVVDYDTFRRTHYQRGALDIYQKGVEWIFRGLTQILLYRIIYYYLSPSPSAVHNALDVAMFLASAWLLYLHISGIFHLAIGIVCLFGFDLPETNRLYFLASSPSEIWRRANIYWKDFMMKIFFYPLYKFLQKRKRSLKQSMVAATVGVFAATWLLHSYQWFWILGKLLFGGVDLGFWTVFALLVLANTLWTLSRGRARTLRRKSEWSFRAALSHSGRVLGMFAIMSVMWSWWNTRDNGEWVAIVSSGLQGDSRSFFFLALIILGLLGSGVAIQYVARKWPASAPWTTLPGYRPAVGMITASVLLLAAGSRDAQARLDNRSAMFVASLQTDRLNARDTELQNRSYYEALMDADRPTSLLAHGEVAAPENENRLVRKSDAIRQTGDALGYELVPSYKTVINGIVEETNRWGMRDKDYSLEKPFGTHRLALIGASVVMGSGVGQQNVFEALLEDRLNAATSESKRPRYEILNFAVRGYGMVQYVVVTERKVFRFHPDILMLATLAGESDRSAAELTDLIVKNVPLPPFLAEIKRFAGVEAGMKRVEVLRRMSSEAVGQKVEALGYSRIVADCRREGVIPVWIYLPDIRADASGFRQGRAATMKRLAQDAGFIILDLGDAYDGHSEAELLLSPWDSHPNALGHRLIARRLYDALRANDRKLGLELPPALQRQ